MVLLCEEISKLLNATHRVLSTGGVFDEWRNLCAVHEVSFLSVGKFPLKDALEEIEFARTIPIG